MVVSPFLSQLRSSVYFKTVIALALISGFALTVIGLSRLPWPQSIVWSDNNALLRFLGFLVLAAIAVFLLAKKLNHHTGLAVVITAALLAVVAGALWPLLAALWFACASSVLGYWLLGRLKIQGQNWLNCLLVGAGLYGTVAGLLAHFPVNYQGVYGAALALPLVLGWRVVVASSRNLLTRVNKTNVAEAGISWLDVAIGAVALVYFAVALMPELGFDSLAMHLFIPAHMALRHQWGFDASTYVWAVMPMLGDWIFSMGYLIAGETAVRLINVGFIFILGGLLRNIVLWAGGTALGARWAVLIFLSTPLTFTEGSSLYIESIWASFVLAGALSVLNACTTSGKPKFELPVAGLLLGCALAAKAVTFTILPVLFLLLVWRYKLWFKTAGIQVLMLGLGLFSIIGFIPYATAWRLTGNPVFPLFNKIFQSPYFPITENFNNQAYSTGMTWDVLYRVTFETVKYLEAYAGASGFQWLLLFITTILVLIIGGQRRAFALLLVGALSVAIAFRSQSYLRYVFPSLIIMIASIGVALSTTLSTKSFMRKWWYAAAVSTVVLNLLFINTGNAFYQDFPLKSIFDQSKKEKYLLARLPIRNAVELVNRLNAEKMPVAVFADPLAAGLSGDALYTNWYNMSFQKEISSINTEQDISNILSKRNVNFLILDSNWNGVNCCGGGAEKQALIEKVSDQIAEYGSLTVRKLKTNYQFKTELLINSDFKSITGWALSAGTKYDSAAGIILAGVDAPAYQQVVVAPGVRYLNTVEARCAKEQAAGRVQINWIDLKGQFISASIKTFDCSPTWAEHKMEVVAPQDAVKAMVYVSGQSTIPLEFKSNSLRQ